MPMIKAQPETVTALVVLLGCDDRNEFEMELTKSDLDFLARLKEKSFEASEISCQPRAAVVLEYSRDDEGYFEYEYPA